MNRNAKNFMIIPISIVVTENGEAKSIYDFVLEDIDGNDVPLGNYKNRGVAARYYEVDLREVTCM